MTTHHPSHSIRAIAAAVMLAALSLVLACQTEDVSAPGDPAPADKRQINMVSDDSGRVQEYLSRLWRLSNHEQWEVISGEIFPAEGGIIAGTPASWPDEYRFSVEVPPGAINEASFGNVGDGPPADAPLTITILVPRNTGSYLPPVFHLLPDGIVFAEPVTVTFCYPPWLHASGYYAKFCFWEVPGSPPTYEYSDLERVHPAGPDLRLGVEFQTTHFTRWGMDNGAGGEEDINGGFLPMPLVHW